jgi:protein-S-isoprenylcysteine O-methyltransferase Ste14
MNAFLEQDWFYIAIESIISLSVFLLFVSIIIDFTLYSRDEDVQTEKKSIVETGSMTLFFLLFYLILLSGKWVWHISPGHTKEILTVLGTMMIVTGCFINIRGRFHLGKNWANQIKIYEGHDLVQTGMYRWVRHPLYASLILMFYGACLIFRSAAAVLAVTLVFVPFMYYRALQEENLLIQKFSQYEKYRRKTGMFLPRILKKEVGQYD